MTRSFAEEHDWWRGQMRKQPSREISMLCMGVAHGMRLSQEDYGAGDMKATEQEIEAAAKAIYALDPFYESGEYVDGFPVTPGGHLTWEQARARDAEFGDDPRMGSVTKFAFDAAKAALSAIGL